MPPRPYLTGRLGASARRCPPRIGSGNETVDDTTLRQGDISNDLICYWLSQDLEPESPAPPVSKATGTWIVAQASCDMEARGLKRVVMGQLGDPSDGIPAASLLSWSAAAPQEPVEGNVRQLGGCKIAQSGPTTRQ